MQCIKDFIHSIISLNTRFVEVEAACDICIENCTEVLTYEKSFTFLLSSGDFTEDAGFAPDIVCKAGSPAFHQRHPKYIYPHWPVWILGMVQPLHPDISQTLSVIH